jgi:predicted amidohydrolase
MIVAAVQFEPVLLDMYNNISQAKHYSFEAASKGASVVVLPELCISGHVLRTAREALDCSQDKNGYQTVELAEVARTFNCHIVFGYVELYEGKLYNSAAVVGPGGLECNIQKHNLWGSDNLWATPSEQLHQVAITRSGRLGTLICRDALNTYRESYQFSDPAKKFYRRGSIDVLALLTNWGENYGYPDSSWVELSEELDCNVIVSNRIGKERDMQFKGGSCIVDRNRKVWTNGSSFTEPAVVGGIVI